MGADAAVTGGGSGDRGSSIAYGDVKKKRAFTGGGVSFACRIYWLIRSIAPQSRSRQAASFRENESLSRRQAGIQDYGKP